MLDGEAAFVLFTWSSGVQGFSRKMTRHPGKSQGGSTNRIG